MGIARECISAEPVSAIVGTADTINVEDAKHLMEALAKFNNCGGHSTKGVLGGASIQDSKVLHEALRLNKFLPPTYFLTDSAQRENLCKRVNRQNEFIERRLLEAINRGGGATERASLFSPTAMLLLTNKEKWKQEYADVQSYIARREFMPP